MTQKKNLFHVNKKSCQQCESHQVSLSVPLAEHTYLKVHSYQEQNLKEGSILNAARGRSLNVTVDNKVREKSTNNKHSRLRQTSTRDTAHRNCSDTAKDQLISQLHYLRKKCCQPSLAFSFTRAPIKRHWTEHKHPLLMFYNCKYVVNRQ